VAERDPVQVANQVVDAVLDRLVFDLPFTKRRAFVHGEFTDLPDHFWIAATGEKLRSDIRKLFEPQVERALKAGATPAQITTVGMKSIDFAAMRAKLPEFLKS
jgi:hypothetical protein